MYSTHNNKERRMIPQIERLASAVRDDIKRENYRAFEDYVAAVNANKILRIISCLNEV